MWRRRLAQSKHDKKKILEARKRFLGDDLVLINCKTEKIEGLKKGDNFAGGVLTSDPTRKTCEIDVEASKKLIEEKSMMKDG